jgi:predicted CoA-binding protein
MMSEKNKKQTVVVLGASPKPERYSNKAVKLLMEYGHRVLPVHPAIGEIEGLKTLASLGGIDEPVDTLTLYVSPRHLTELQEDIIRLKPGRVIFNPGSEHPPLIAALQDAGISCAEACTLVMLKTGQF